MDRLRLKFDPLTPAAALPHHVQAGQIKGFTGIDDPYEAPEKAEIVIDTETMKPEVAAERILKYLEERRYLSA